MTTTLYHFTCPWHLHRIATDGIIKTTESNIGSPSPVLPPFGEHYAPDVVWAFDIPDPGLGRPEMLNGQLHPQANKQLVRITFQTVPFVAYPWDGWAREQGINPEWKRVLERVGPPDHWYVVLHPIERKLWERVEYRPTVDDEWGDLNTISVEGEEAVRIFG